MTFVPRALPSTATAFYQEALAAAADLPVVRAELNPVFRLLLYHPHHLEPTPLRAVVRVTFPGHVDHLLSVYRHTRRTTLPSGRTGYLPVAPAKYGANPTKGDYEGDGRDEPRQ